MRALWQRVLEAVCRWRGHKMAKAGGYANTESAAEYLYCARCGFTHEITYY